MSRRPSLSLVALIACAAAGFAQIPATEPAGDDSPDGLLESYLRSHALNGLLAEHLRGRLERAGGAERVSIAERLGAVYAEMLAGAVSGAERDALIEASGELLERVPAADTFDLRIALTKARYLTAEQAAERARLGLVSAPERHETVEAFRSIAAGLGMLGERADRRVGALERRERTGGVSDLPSLRLELGESRRQRSLAKYYAGWSNYYTALLTGSPATAERALADFGYLLGAEGGEPTLERLPRSLLRYEHVARAALGVALCHSARGEHISAVMWLSEIEKSDTLHPSVLAQLFSRKVTILAAARRWDTLAREVERRRSARLDERTPNPLRTTEARLLAVEVLESLRAPDADASRREAAEPIIAAAMGDLIALGESAQVLDLVERYGTLPLGGDGFIARYVRALRAYRGARETHRVAEADDSAPTREPTLVAAYLESAELLTHAFESPDADSFPEERAGAGLMLGMSLYYKDAPEEAAQRFEQTARVAPKGRQHAEALWMAILSLERAIESGRGGLTHRLHSAALLFVQTYPRDDRSARLLLRFAGTGLFDTETSLGVLMQVGRGSPLYLPARRHAADVLYRRYAGAVEPGKSELAARFLSVVFELIETDLGVLRRPAGTDDQAEAAASALLRARQALDAALTPLAADPASARRALAVLEEISARTGPRGPELEGEFAYRRLQLAVALDDEAARDSAHRELEAIGGRFLRAADRFLYTRALERWRRSRNAADARRVVEIGLRLLGEGEIDRADLAVADSCAVAATALWEALGDRWALGGAIGIDRRVLADHVPTAGLLRRLARNSEAGGQPLEAFELWSRLAGAVREGSGDWFEARYEAIRVLAGVRPDEARAALRQHKILHPMLGPPPWGDLFAELEIRLNRGGGRP